MRRSLDDARTAIYGCQTELQRIRATFPEAYLPHAALMALSLHADAIDKAIEQIDTAGKYPLSADGRPAPRWPQAENEALQYLAAIRVVRRTWGIVEKQLDRYKAKVEKKAAKRTRREERRRYKEFKRLGRQLRAASARQNAAALERLLETQEREMINLAEQSENDERESSDTEANDGKEAEAEPQEGGATI